MFCIVQILVSRFALAASAVAMGLAAPALGGCGQQGPLYLPTEAAAAQRATLPETLRPGEPQVLRNPGPAPPSSVPPAPTTSKPGTP